MAAAVFSVFYVTGDKHDCIFFYKYAVGNNIFFNAG